MESIWLIIALLLIGIAISLYCACVSNGKAKQRLRLYYDIIIILNDRDLLKEWEKYIGWAWPGNADELRLHIRNLRERLDE